MVMQLSLFELRTNYSVSKLLGSANVWDLAVVWGGVGICIVLSWKHTI